jgi:hypothetical protein
MSTKIKTNSLDTVTEKPPSLSRFKRLKQKIKIPKLNLDFLLQHPVINIPSWLRTSLLFLSVLIIIYLLIISSLSNPKLIPSLVVGLFICFLLKTIFDCVKIWKTVTNMNEFSELLTFDSNIIRAILSVCIVLYIILIVLSSKMYHVLFKNLKSPCLPKIVNLDAFATIFIVLLTLDNFILNKPELYIFSIIIYVCASLAMLIHYKKDLNNLKNKLDDNCVDVDSSQA